MRRNNNCTTILGQKRPICIELIDTYLKYYKRECATDELQT